MGTQNSKLRQFYRKTLRRRKVLKKHWCSPAADEAAAQLIEMGGEEEITLLEMLEPRSASAAAAVHSPTNFENCHELEEMQQLIDTLAGSLRKQLDALVSVNRQKVQHCSVRWKNVKNSFLFADAIPGKERRKLESQTDECRLRSSLLTDKITNCLDYLQNFDTLLNSMQSEQRRQSGDSDFLREFLLKSARHQHRKGQIGQSVDTFCQLLLATGGHLTAEEMEVLADICREKIQQIREFHERISQTVRQLNESNTVRENLVVQELWGQVLEDLRSECAESFEIVMQVKSDQIGTEIDQNYRQKKTEQLKLLMASTVCALWLHITPRDHEEFDDIKELFFSTLDDYIEIFRIKNRQNLDKNCQRGASIELEKTVRELMGEYPTVANTKKMRKIAQRIFVNLI